MIMFLSFCNNNVIESHHFGIISDEFSIKYAKKQLLVGIYISIQAELESKSLI